MPDAAATLRWKLMSWTRNTCGSSQRREQARDLVGERGHLIGHRALGRQAGGADLEDAPRLVHLLAGEAVQRGQEAERLGAERRRTIRNVGARAMPRTHDAHRRQRAQAGAHGRTAHADVDRQIALGRQAVAPPQLAALDQRAHVGHDLSRAVGQALFGHESCEAHWRCAKWLYSR